MSIYEPPGTDVPLHILEAQERAALGDTNPPNKPTLAVVPDRIVPHDTDAEAAILGAALMSATARDELSKLDPTDFHTNHHAVIARAINELHTAGHPVDAITVADQLANTGQLDIIGGPTILLDLERATPSTTSAPRYASIVRRHATLRHIGTLGQHLTDSAFGLGANPANISILAQELLDQIHEEAQADTDHLVRVGETLTTYLDELEAKQHDNLTGIPTGIDALDASLGGLQDGRLYTVAGRPGMGKSDIAAHLARQASLAEHTTLVVSIEMPTEELTDRWVAAGSSLSATRLANGKVSERDWERLVPALAELERLPLWVDDNPGANTATIRASLRRTKAKLVIVDYLQIIDAPHAETRQIAVTGLIRTLKRLSREADIPVVVLAQLNRGVEQRLVKRPMLSDLRESGAIEQESDAVLMLYRDDQYNTDSKDKGVMEIIVAKNRGGPLGTVYAGYLPDVKQLVNLAGRN